MPSLILQYHHDILNEYDLGERVTIGRLPDNTVIIDNPAVSGHHARVVREGSHCFIEDLRSMNGTFVNDQRVSRHQLQDGDVVTVGKHRLVYDPMAGSEPVLAPASAPILTNLHDTVYLDTQKHKALLANITTLRVPITIGILSVLSGRSDAVEYRLDRHTTIVGKSDRAAVRLQGWWKPQVAVVITRMGDSYVATPVSGRPRINNETLADRHPLAPGDVLSVCGLVLEFSMKPLVHESRNGSQVVESQTRRVAGSG